MLTKPVSVSVRELKAKASEILRNLEETPGKEVLITRHGKPCAKLVSLKGKSEGIPWEQRKSLRGSWKHLPHLTYADFVEAKRIWEPKIIDAGQ